MGRLRLTKSQARQFILAHQGLWPPRSLTGKRGVLWHIGLVGCIQFDPLDIVGHNSELVLQARVLGFRRAMLQELLYDERQLIDGYDKMMSIYSVQDWPYFRRDRESAARDLADGAEPIRSILPQVRKDIMDRGPLSSIDLEYNDRVRWPWGPARLSRAALESMYFCGELVVHHRVHTRRVYDLAVRHLSHGLLSAPDPNVGEEEYRDWRVLRRIGGIGLLWERSSDAWLGIPGVRSKERRESLDRLLTQGKVTEAGVDGIPPTLYLRAEDESALYSRSATRPRLRAQQYLRLLTISYGTESLSRSYSALTTAGRCTNRPRCETMATTFFPSCTATDSSPGSSRRATARAAPLSSGTGGGNRESPSRTRCVPP